MFRDLIVPLDVEDSSRERVVTIAQGLTNGKHTLEITDGPNTHVAAIAIKNWLNCAFSRRCALREDTSADTLRSFR